MKRTEAVEWCQLAALVVGLAGLGVVYGRGSHALESNAQDIEELSRITRDLAATSIRSETELRALAVRVQLLEAQR
jgi:hypothetical protein